MELKYTVKPESFKLDSGAFPDGGDAALPLFAARNDTAAFQIVISGGEPFTLNVGRCAAFSQKGPLPTLRLEAESPFECRMNIVDMHADNDGVLKADALLSAPTLELAADEPRAVFCELVIPPDAAPGSYSPRVRLLEGGMFSDERKVGEVKLDLEVAELVMHGVRENKFHLDLWQHSCNIARKCEVEPWNDAHFAALENYVRSLGELGQKAVTLIVSEVPWAGQSCFRELSTPGNLFEYSIVRTVRHKDGSFECDYSAMQRYIDLCARYGVDRELSVYGLCGIWCSGDYGRLADDYPDALHVRFYDEADGAYKYMKNAADIDFYIASLEKYFVTTGQIDRVRIAADEPADVEAYRATLARLAKLAPSFRFKAAINHPEFVSEFGNEVYDFVPYYGSLCSKYHELSHYMETMKGKRFLYYVCCGPNFPNTFLGSGLTESLYLCVLASYARLDGLLRWSYTVWNDDPRADVRYGQWRAGDTNFVYPQKNGAPLLSLRYKALKRGIQLYELLEELREVSPESLDSAYSIVLRERDITKCSGKASLGELCSTDEADYAALKRYLVGELTLRTRK